MPEASSSTVATTQWPNYYDRRSKVCVYLRDDHVWLVILDEGQSVFPPGGGSPHDLYAPSSSGGEDGLKAFSEHGVVVCKVHTYRHFGLSSQHEQGPCRKAHTEVAH